MLLYIKNINIISMKRNYKNTFEENKTDFKKFEDHSFFTPKNLMRVFSKFGYYKGDAFKEWIGKLIEAKTGNPDFTFGQLHNDISIFFEPKSCHFFFVYFSLSKTVDCNSLIFRYLLKKNELIFGHMIDRISFL